jgi:hypothetical protein
VMIVGDMFHNDGLVSLRASEGSTVRIQNGAPMLLSTGTVYSGGEAHFALIPALAIPFVVLAAFAILGCRSLLRRQQA